MEFDLISGTGNTFVMINLMTANNKKILSDYFPNLTYSEIAHKLCSHPLIETDGAVFVTPSANCDFKWFFYNRDGSEAEMCGNAARCVTQFAHDQGLIQKRATFETQAGQVAGEILSNGNIRVQMPKIKNINTQQTIQNKRIFVRFDYIDTGVPHCVIKVSSLSQLDELRSIAKELRGQGYFPPQGANITFRVSFGKNKIESITYERGVEDFTQACGTGAVAAAYSQSLENGGVPMINVSVPGGELTVELKDDCAYLSGEVRYIGRLSFDKLLDE